MKAKLIVQAGVIAGLYVVLTIVSNSLGLASGVIQLRLSEALTILPWFTWSAVPGVFLGCLLANLLTGAVWIDVLVGSLTSLVAAWLTYRLRHKPIGLAPIPPIVLNALIIPFVLRYAYGIPGSVIYFMVTIGLGQMASAGVLGMFLGLSLKARSQIFNNKA